MSKRTFASRLFAANTFASAAWTGVATGTTLIEMHIFRYPNGTIDSEDGNIWLWPPFDMSIPGGNWRIATAQVFTAGVEQGQVFHNGANAARVHTAGVVAAQVQ